MKSSSVHTLVEEETLQGATSGVQYFAQGHVNT